MQLREKSADGAKFCKEAAQVVQIAKKAKVVFGSLFHYLFSQISVKYFLVILGDLFGSVAKE